MSQPQRRIRVHLIAGARPNFVKIAPLWAELSRQPWCEVEIVHTGQHFDLNMSEWMFRDLGLPEPHHHLAAETGSHARVTGSVMVAYERLCLGVSKPDWVIVVGDVDSTIACALTAKKLGLRVAHLEAGLRSFDRTMPEELNRVLTDSIADLLWTPSIDGDANLVKEGVDARRVECVGNIMIDALISILPKVQAWAESSRPGAVPQSPYGVVTLHRPSNVDEPKALLEITESLCTIVQEVALVFPVHPRTRKALARDGLEDRLGAAGVVLVDALSYIPFIALVREAAFLVTDSGGVQEETSYLGVPCLTLRENTERPITITCGTNRLVTAQGLTEAVRAALATGVRPAEIPLWDGRTASRVAASLARHAGTTNTTMDILGKQDAA